MKMFGYVLLMGVVLSLGGCANKHKAFGSQHSSLEASICANCQKKQTPFYVAGVWQEKIDVE